jgi:hypothetical protein
MFSHKSVVPLLAAARGDGKGLVSPGVVGAFMGGALGVLISVLAGLWSGVIVGVIVGAGRCL